MPLAVPESPEKACSGAKVPVNGAVPKVIDVAPVWNTVFV